MTGNFLKFDGVFQLLGFLNKNQFKSHLARVNGLNSFNKWDENGAVNLKALSTIYSNALRSTSLNLTEAMTINVSTRKMTIYTYLKDKRIINYGLPIECVTDFNITPVDIGTYLGSRGLKMFNEKLIEHLADYLDAKREEKKKDKELEIYRLKPKDVNAVGFLLENRGRLLSLNDACILAWSKNTKKVLGDEDAPQYIDADDFIKIHKEMLSDAGSDEMKVLLQATVTWLEEFRNYRKNTFITLPYKTQLSAFVSSEFVKLTLPCGIPDRLPSRLVLIIKALYEKTFPENDSKKVLSKKAKRKPSENKSKERSSKRKKKTIEKPRRMSIARPKLEKRVEELPQIKKVETEETIEKEIATKDVLKNVLKAIEDHPELLEKVRPVVLEYMIQRARNMF